MLATSQWDSTSAPYVKTYKPHWIGAITLDPFDSDHAIFIAGYGLWATSHVSAIDGGGSTPWHFDCDGLEETVVTALASPPEGAHLLSAMGDYAGFRHDDLTQSPAAGTHQPAYGSQSQHRFCRTTSAQARPHSFRSRLWRPSLDGGTTWKDFPSTPPTAKSNGPGTIALSADGLRLVWLPKGSAPYFSSDDGLTWTQSRTDFRSMSDYRTSYPGRGPRESGEILSL